MRTNKNWRENDDEKWGKLKKITEGKCNKNAVTSSQTNELLCGGQTLREVGPHPREACELTTPTRPAEPVGSRQWGAAKGRVGEVVGGRGRGR